MPPTPPTAPSDAPQDPSPVAPPGLVFVVGRGRSGTTLLARMLSAHPAIQIAPEGFFALSLRRRYGRGPWDARRIARFCRDLTGERRMGTWQLDLYDVRERLRSTPQLDYAAACRAVYASYAEATRGRRGLRFVGDKNPHYALFVTELSTLFPAARFVHIVRDPRDNVVSFQRVPFDAKDAAVLAARYRHYNTRVLTAAEALVGRYHRLRYEDLVAAPEATLGALCGFLGVPFDPAMLDFHAHPEAGFYGADSAWFERLSQPLSAAATERFRGHLSSQQLATVEALCEPLMARFGYAPVAGSRWRPGSALARLRGHVLGAASVAAERVLFGAVPPELRSLAINAYRSRTGRI